MNDILTKESTENNPKNSRHWNEGYTCIGNDFWLNKDLTLAELKLLGILLTFSNYSTPKPIAISYLQKLSKLDRKTIIRAIKKFKEMEYIEELVKGGGREIKIIRVTCGYSLSFNKGQKNSYDSSCIPPGYRLNPSQGNDDPSAVESFPPSAVESFHSSSRFSPPNELTIKKINKKEKTNRRGPKGPQRKDPKNCLNKKEPFKIESNDSCKPNGSRDSDDSFFNLKEKKGKPYQIMEIWNRIAKELRLPTVNKLNEVRTRKLKNAIKDVPSLEDWETLISQIENNRFYLGENDSGWKANFDWLLQKNKCLQLLEQSTVKKKKKNFATAEDLIRRNDELVRQELEEKQRQKTLDAGYPEEVPW